MAGAEVSQRGRLMRGGAWALSGKVFAALAQLFVNVLLARLLIPADLGAYFIVVSIVTFAASFGTLGVDLAVVRLVAENESRPRRVIQSVYLALGIGLVGTLLSCVVYMLVQEPLSLTVFRNEGLLVASLAVVLWIAAATLQRLLAEIFRGFHDVRFSTLISGTGTRGGGILMGIVQPLALALAAWLGFRSLFALVFVSGLVSLLIVVFASVKLAGRLQRLRKQKEEEHVDPWWPSAKAMLVISAPLFVTIVMSTLRVQVDVWLLGAIASSQEVALYGAALRLVALVVTPLLVMNAVLPPIIAELSAQGKLPQLERLLRSVATLVGLPSLVILLLLSFGGAPILGLIYGEFYRQGATVLIILSVAQLLNVITGSCTLVLSMTGHQQVNMVITSVSALCAVVLGFFLTRYAGALGMAIASAVALTLQNLLSVLAVKRLLGIWTHVHLSAHMVQDFKLLLRKGKNAKEVA